jgi:hypothetical protein
MPCNVLGVPTVAHTITHELPCTNTHHRRRHTKQYNGPSLAAGSLADSQAAAKTVEAAISAACRANNITAIIGIPHFFDPSVNTTTTTATDKSRPASTGPLPEYCTPFKCWYNTALVVSNTGTFVYRQAKMHSAGPDGQVGRWLDVFELPGTGGVVASIQICYDAYFTQMSVLPVLKGSKIIFDLSSERGCVVESRITCCCFLSHIFFLVASVSSVRAELLACDTFLQSLETFCSSDVDVTAGLQRAMQIHPKSIQASLRRVHTARAPDHVLLALRESVQLCTRRYCASMVLVTKHTWPSISADLPHTHPPTHTHTHSHTHTHTHTHPHTLQVRR